MIIIGHRGARGEAPENTLEGFVYAFSQGVRHFELDIQISQDGHLVVHHDSRLKRTTAQPGQAHHHSASALAGFDARHNTPPWPEPVGVPRLDAVLDALPDAESFQLEVKATDSTRMRAIAQALRRLLDGAERERCIVTSAALSWIRQFRTDTPTIRTGAVVEYAWQRPVNTLKRTGADVLVLRHTLVTPKRVAAVHAMGRKLSVWTVNDVHRAHQLRQSGVDSLITDYPTHMLKAMAHSLPHQLDT